MDLRFGKANIVQILTLLICAFRPAKACISIENHDFSALDGVIWESHGGDNRFEISVCQPVTALKPDSRCSSVAAVCQIDSDGHAVTVGNFTSPTVTETESGVIQLTLKGQSCGENGSSYTTRISFKCGKTLGSPVFLNSYDCGIDFEWYTSVACKSSPAVNEVKCYIYNDKGKKIDLSPLIKLHGSYEVLNFGSQFYINVCRDISEASDCEAGSAACVPSGPSYKNAGHVKKSLSLDDAQRPFIKYINEVKGDDIPAECTQAPSTLITFVCPARGESAKPVLLGSLDCQYEVLWETEYACPEETLTSSTCVLTQDIHGVNINLTQLQGHTYTVNGSTSGKVYTYYLSICGRLDITCVQGADDKTVSACQMVPGDIDSGKSLGKSDQKQLRYSDGELILTYKGGTQCHTNFQRMTVINLHCNKSLPATGELVFTAEDDCTYVFDLQTPLACTEKYDSSMCQVEKEGHLYDLSGLVITESMDKAYWEALKTDPNDDSFVILNVCRELVRKGLASLCAKGSAACVMDRPGHWVNLGKPSQPVYDDITGQVQLHYKDGSPCGQGNAESIINFICKPGMLDSPPRLIRKSDDGCHYEFEWETASVCAQRQVVGDNCRVVDEELGLSFDLHPLINTDKGYYLVPHAESHHNYYINVCSKVTGTPCKVDDTSKVEIAACQLDTVTNNTFVTGLVSTKLRYGDDFLNLTYTGGDPYNSSPKRDRSTEIAFFCDPTAGKGMPEFVEETNYTYVFRWATSYACADVPVECAIVDDKTGAEYDLTSLVRKPSQSDWVTVDDEQTDQKKRTFYINICHHLVSDVQGCDLKSSVCEKTLEGSTERVSHANLGKSLTPPIVDSEGELTIVLTAGEACLNHPNMNYTTKIHLHCDHGAVSTSPRLLDTDQNQCLYVFKWDHAAACPIQQSKTAVGDICTLTDSALGFTYNLKPLMKTDYSVTHSGDTYLLHICGKVSGQCKRIGENEPAVCLGDTTLGEVSTELEYGGSGFITLTYKGKITSSGQEKVVIEFRCDRFVGEGKPQFIEKDGLVYLFRFLTSYACPPATVECKAVDDHGNVFDLSYLSKSSGNWLAVDTRPNHSDLRYYINVCRPVNPVAGVTSSCSGLAGGCQTDGQNQAYSLGYIQGSPVAAADGTVILRYTGGDRCHKDQAKENFRSMIITFYCSNVEHDPVFVMETEDCEYHFSWQTPLACPISKSVGSHCSVITPNFLMTFNLSSLQKLDYYRVQAGEYEFLLNVCKNISGVSGECQDVGSCQTKPANSQRINAGKANGRLIYEDGELRLVYEGGKGDCHGQYERQTIITFTCDTAVGSGLPLYLNESSTCQYLFQWPTSLACPTTQAELRECSVQDDMGKQYDLSTLRASNRNYVYIDHQKKVKYLINVCSPVIHGRGAACTAQSAVCLVHLNTTTSKYENLGDFTTSVLKVESDMITLKYTGGRQCNNGGRAMTTIQLKCDPTEVSSEPYLLDDADGCNYVFQWMTSHACPINTAVTPGGGGGDCTATDPQTGTVFSLAKLKNRKWTIQDSKGHSYDVSVCSALEGSYCGDNVGSCQYETDNPDKHWNCGQPSTSLMYNDGTLQLLYKGGERCHNDKYERSTVIDFVCGFHGLGEGEPVFITEDANCTYFLSWHTDLACNSEPLACWADTATEHYDLSSLVLSEGYHSAITSPNVDSDASYYINLCRPLNPIPGTKCPPQSAVCKVTSDGTITSLGQALQSPKVDPVTKKVVIIMEHGDTCPSDRTQNWRTKIIFECDPGLSSGTPSLEEVNEGSCEVVFTWPTYLVCAADGQPAADNDCSFTDHRRDYTYNFTSLRHKVTEPGYMVPSKSGQGTYYVNICGSTSGAGMSCGKAGVCLVSDNKAISFGQSDQMTFVSSEFNVKMVYTGGDVCQGQARESYIIMECDYGVSGTGVIELSYEQSCSVAFVFRTPLACLPVRKDCIFSHDGMTYDFTPLSRTKDSWTLQDPDKNSYWLNLCQGVHNGPIGCPEDAAVCWQPADGSGVSTLAKVLSQTVSVDSSGHILVKYSNVGQCQRADGKTDSPAFKIYLICGSSVGKPVFKSRSNDHCVFEVEWKTVYACKEQREPIFAVDGYITDPRTNLQISLKELSGGKTYELKDDPYRYILNLDSSPDMDSAECRNVVVCQTRLDEPQYHDSLGEKDTERFFIKGEILEALYTSPTLCDEHSSVKAVSIIDFHCSSNNRTIGPVFVYKSEKCEYIFDWFTPAVCALAQMAPSGTNAAISSHGLNPTTLGVILGVTLTILIFVFLAVVLYKQERRARVITAFRHIFRKPSSYTAYTYSSLNQAAEEESSLLHNSQGQYGADSQHSSNIQPYDDDSDEDILQL